MKPIDEILKASDDIAKIYGGTDWLDSKRSKVIKILKELTNNIQKDSKNETV